MLSCRRLLVAFLTFAGLLLGSGALQAQTTTYTSIVVFGDSLSDTGNIANLTQNKYAIRYPSDNTLLGFDYTDGRFTDGTDTQPAAQAYTGVWIEQLAASMSGKPAVKDSLDGGTNYAYGDATTATGTTTEMETFDGVPVSITLNDMGEQVATYLATSPTPTASTLFVLWGGSNDLLQAAEAGNSPMTAATTAITNELSYVQQLVAAGATSFMLPNLPPLGATPEGAASPLAASLNQASEAFAVGLAQGLAQLQASYATQGKTITFYQPDVFTLFSTIAANPQSVGFSNLSAAAQNIAASPDTYLIWDGLHPTTTGHHFVAATAANLLTPLVASTTTLTAPSAALPGSTVTLSAAVTATPSTSTTTTTTTATPTGLVSFFNGTTFLGSGALSTTGTASTTFAVPAATTTPYSVTAVYAGDETFNSGTSAAAAIPLIATAVSTTTAVTSSNLNANLNSAVTFTATVTPAVTTDGTPTGTVTFLDGTTTLGTGTLSSGAATYTTSTLTAGTHTITAVYAGGGVFGGSSAAAISQVIVAPSYTLEVTPSSTTVAAGANTTAAVTAIGIGGYTGTFTVACGTVPAKLSCSVSTPTLSLTSSGTSVSSIVTIGTSGSTTSSALFSSRPGSRGMAPVLSATLLFPAVAGLFFGLRRRRGLHGALLGSVLFGLISVGALFGLSGCSSNGSSGNNAAAGTYVVPLIVTPASGTAQTLNLTVIVQ